MASDTSGSATRTKPSMSGSWWFLLVPRIFFDSVAIATYLHPPPRPLGETVGGSAPVYVELLGYPFSYTLVGIILGSYFLALPGVYFDRKVIAKVSGWTPSVWYYPLILVPLLGMGAGLRYLYKRNRSVGIP